MSARDIACWVCAVALAGCAARGPGGPDWNFRAPLPDDHVFASIVTGWQAANRLAAHERPRSVPPTPLAHGYADFTRDLRAHVAERVIDWVRTQSGLYFRRDGPFDYWPTLPEVMHRGGDDCDGMELLTFQLLRDLGWRPGELYRAVLARPESGQHHMVTLWFAQGPRSDPLVLDPTSEIAYAITPLSQLAGWQPVVLFDESQRFRPVPLD